MAKLRKSEGVMLSIAAVSLLLAGGVKFGAMRSITDFQISSSIQVSAPEPTDVGIIDINTADVELLDCLPGIGEVLAQRIVAYREENGAFAETSDIMNVSGIGEATFEEIKGLITVEGTE